MVLLNTVIFLLIWFVSSFDVNGLTQQPSSPLSQELINLAKECSEADCIKVASNISDIGIQLVNTYASLLMHDLAQDVLKEALYYIPDGDKSGLHLIHMQSMLAFAQGDVLSAKEYWSLLNSTDSLAAKRSLAAQLLMSGNEVIGMSMLSNYTNIIGNKFIKNYIQLGFKMELGVKLKWITHPSSPFPSHRGCVSTLELAGCSV